MGGDRKRLTYREKVILAPMVKVGTLPTRLLALDYGADIVYTEEIIDWRLIRSTRIENRVLDTVDYVDNSDGTLVLRIGQREKGRLVLQIGTSDRERAVGVAKMVVGDVDAIDVNMGCPKSFSLKGGMGAALLTQPQKIKDILCGLVDAVGDRIAVTCKIRILPDLQATLDLVQLIRATGVDAIAVHGRTKEERPNNYCHIDYIQAVVKSVDGLLPVIANGGSSNNRESSVNTHEGVMKFWKESGADSVMVARAAEWNLSVFRDGPRSSVLEVIDRYLDYAILFDCPFIIVKYNVQQTLGGLQESAQGKELLASSTMLDLCKAFGREKNFLERKEWIQQKAKRLGLDNVDGGAPRRDPLMDGVASKRRLLGDVRSSAQVDDVALAGELGESSDCVNVTEMYAPFVRGHHKEGADLPKTKLLTWLRLRSQVPPVYKTWQKDKMFRSVVEVNVQPRDDPLAFSSCAWEKNKRFSEQAAAKVAVRCLLGDESFTESSDEQGDRKRTKLS